MKAIDILMVEDNRGDVVLVQAAMEKLGLEHRISVVSDGAEALDFLRRRGRYAEVHRPGLILLDLKLPRKDGREVLSEIRGDPALREILLVLLSSSRAELELARAQGMPSEYCLEKPSTYPGFVELVERIETFRRNRAKEKAACEP